MRFLITAKAYEGIYRPEDVRALRDRVGRGYANIKESGKLVDSGVFGDQRGGFFLVDIQKAGDIHELLGPELLDTFRIEAHPIQSFEELGAYLQKLAKEGR